MDHVDKFLALAQDLDFLDEDNDEDYNPDDGDETECEGDESDLIDADQSINDAGERIDGKDGDDVHGDVEEEETEGESETDETGLIAQRTRSKFSLDDAIELDSFNFPDVDPDLYGDSEADHEFLNFCQSIFADDPIEESKGNDGDSDLEEDDPLFEATLTDDGNDDYLEDLDDRSTTIPEKEIVQLLDELNEIPFEVTGHVGDWVPAWSSNADEFNSILHSQMTQYVQILTQSYLLTRDRRTLVSIAKNSSDKLTHLDSLPCNSGTMRPINLTAALELVKSKCIKEIKELKRGYNWRPCPLSLETKATIFGHPTIFRIEQLLPKHGYYDLQATFNGANREKVTFTFAEDYLIALGLFHFSESEVSIVKTCYLKFIIQLLIPIKSESQLRTHIKNVRRRNEKDNPINVYYTRKDVDTFPKFELDTNKTDYDIDLAPDWLKEQILASRPRSRPRLLLPSPIKSTPSSLATHSILKKYQKLNRPNFSPLKDIGNAGWTTSGKVVGGKLSFEGQSDIVGKSGLTSTKSPGKAISGQILASETGKSSSVSDREVTSELKGKVASEPEEEEDGGDDESQQLAALMAASTTICATKLKPIKKESKQKVAARQKESTVKIIQESDRIEGKITEEMKDEAVIEQIMTRSKEVFPKENDLLQFFHALTNLSKSTGNEFKAAFDTLEQLLTRRNAVDIIDLLVERLDPSEVLVLNRSSEYLFMKRFHSFAVKVQAADEALCIKLQKALSGLKQTDAESDLQKIKASVSKVLNGHPYLMTEFSSLFPDEKVASYLVSNEEDFEEMLLDDDDYFFDHILLPDDPDEAKWTTDECPCSCHPQDVASRLPGSIRHCLSCSLRFIDGRIWTVQGNKAELLTIVSKSDDSELSSGISNDAQDHGINDGKITVSEEIGKWSIEEDRRLLQLFQERLSKNSSESVIEEAAKELGRDFGQVASRFKQLIELLKAESQSTDNCDN